MKARAIRFVFALHRWMGVVLGLLMLLWCISGIVMIWWPQPSMTMDGRDYRLEGLAPIVIPAETKFPDIPGDAFLSAARIEMLIDRPVLSIAWEGEQGGGGLFDLATAEKIEGIAEPEALAIAATYAAQHKLDATPKILKTTERDEYTVSGEFNSRRPFYEIALGDSEQTTLYISQKSGAVSQRTTGALRIASWLGWIPHWLYFIELRKDAKLWGQVIIWTSLAGCFLTVLGLFVGIRQFRRRHSTGSLASPYRGAKFWHHMLGLTFGALVLTFTFSGFASMNPWGWLESGPKVGEAAERYAGKPMTWADVKPALETQLSALRARPGDTKQVSYLSNMERVWFLWRTNTETVRMSPEAQPAPTSDAEWAEAASRLAGENGPAKIELLAAADGYYYPSDPKAYPVARIGVPATDTAFYLDGKTGELQYVADPGTRGFRWWHSALHTFDVVGSPIREILIVLAMLGVTAVCGLGAYMGVRKLGRGGKLDNQPPDTPAA